MNEQPRQLYIGGKWVATAETQTIRNPYNGDVIAEVFVGQESDMDDAIAAAYAARQPLAALTNGARGDALARITQGIGARSEELARTLTAESGKPIRDARAEVGRAIHTFQIASEEARRFGAGETIPPDRVEASAHRYGLTRRFPAGVVGAITPFNFPLNLVAHKVAPALAAACPVVLKPAHQTPLTALNLAEIIAEAGLPAGSLNVVHAAPVLGERLAADDRVAVLSFTGSARVGWMLKGKAVRKKVILELGGNAAAIVHDDANLDYASRQLVTAAFAYAGQVCISAQRIYVHESVFDAFVARFVQGARALRLGDPLEEQTDVGPLISEDAANRVLDMVQGAVNGGASYLFDAGATRGNLAQPVALTGTNNTMAIVCEEAFGPVVAIERYHDFEDALQAVNASPFGLQASVFTNDIRRIQAAFERLEVGAVIVNDAPNYRVDHMPYGGVKASGFGREGVRYVMDEMTELRLLAVNPV
jgi:acyl-CoA reductase-like NAD-dependent aldehyde dehydrogenase